MKDRHHGILLGLATYVMWGTSTLFWPLLQPAGAPEILAHRVVWSLAVLVVLMMRVRNLNWLRTMGARKLGLLAIAAALISVTWCTYIWAVNQHHVVETSFGYFINPLVSVVLGVFFLGERLRRIQWIAIGVAAIAVLVLAVDYGRLPWIALTLALSFGLYGFVKKKAGVGALESLSVETALLFVPALGYLIMLQSEGRATFGHASLAKDLLLAAAGLVTAVPLLTFGAAANRIPLSTLGFLQYVSPSIQLFCGVVVLREAMPASRWIGFVLVWIGLAIFAGDSILHRRRTPILSPDLQKAPFNGRCEPRPR